MDARALKEYRRRITHAVAKIDNKPPKFDALVYYKPRILGFDARRIKELDKENMQLLRRINIITRLGSNIDSWLPNITYNTSLPDKEQENKSIMKSNKSLLKRIREATSVYPAAAFIKDWRDEQMKLKRTSKYSGTQRIQFSTATTKDHCMTRDLKFLSDMNPRIRTRCFFEIGVKENNQELGRIVFELYDDIVPRTCANFSAFCRGSNGLSYKGTPFHRIVPGYWCQGGDVTKFNGTGGTSIYGDTFENENFILRHASRGVLSTCTSNENSNDSKFNLTFNQLETMDGKRVVFGKVISGFSNIYKIEEFGTKTGKPIKTVVILNCGILPGKRAASSRKSKKKSEKEENSSHEQ